MTRRLIAASLIFGALVTLAAMPAAAEHKTAESKRSIDLSVDLGVDREGFRLGGQLFGLEGVYGAWLNGQFGKRGLTLDGRVQAPASAFNFKLNAEIAEWLLRFFPGDPF
jgi:hypothetical protein